MRYLAFLAIALVAAACLPSPVPATATAGATMITRQAATPHAPAPVSVPAATVAPAEIAAHTVALINAQRSLHGLPALIPDEPLTHFAQVRADDLAARFYLAHQTPEGVDVFTLFGQYGLVYAYAGENLAYTQAAGYAAAEEAVRGFMNSPSHRANVLKAEYQHIGVAVQLRNDGWTVIAVEFLTRPS